MRRTGARSSALLGVVLVAGPAPAALLPSTELAFRVAARPDSITVGDPIALELEASAPEGTTLLLPQLADSVGPFTVLEARPATAATRGGRVTSRQTVRVTLFRTGAFELPPLALLALREGVEDTLVALSAPIRVRVRPVLQGAVDPSNLRDLKRPVPLARTLGWLWLLVAVAAAIAAGLVRAWLRRRRQAVAPPAPAPPPLPPEVAFEQGLRALRAERLLERGLVRAYTFELSMLFRRYLEARFGFAAAEETRTEIVERASRLPELAPAELRELSAWLEEGDLVKFAKMERLIGEAEAYTQRASAWVRATAAARPLPPAVPATPPVPPEPAEHAASGGAG